MSFLNTLASLASGMLNGKNTAIVRKVESAMKQGIKADSAMAQDIVQMVMKQFPQLRGKANVVQAIDDMIPDSVQTKFGFTPQVMAFIKQALGASVHTPPAAPPQA